MKLDIISYNDLLKGDAQAKQELETALLNKGIVGIRDIPEYEKLSRNYINAARAFTKLPENVRNQYAPDRDSGETEGYELGAEWFKNKNGEWQIDDKKASFYAHVPDKPEKNKWPREVDLKTAYVAMGECILSTGKLLLDVMGLNDTVGLDHQYLRGYARMLHYHKENDATNENPNWCGAHLDHSIFTGLMPAYYFIGDQEVDEPEEAGLYIKPTQGSEFEKIYASDKSVLMFQVGEFGQIASNDRISATKHKVKKAQGGIDRYTLAVFHEANPEALIKSSSVLTQDERYSKNKLADGSIRYGKWCEASFERYRAMTKEKP